jgi:hypothetical protein
MRHETIISSRESAPAIDGSAEFPFVLEFFMVEGLGYRGMGYCDRDGNWRNAFNHDRLMGRIYLTE